MNIARHFNKIITCCRRKTSMVLVIATVSLMTACARPYQAQSGFMDMAGYRSRDIDANTVEVIYRRDKLTDIYVMYRSAEITLERGYQSFRLLAKRDDYFPANAVAESRVKILMFNPSPNDKVPSEAETIENRRRIVARLFIASYVFSAKDVIESLEPKIMRAVK